MNTPPRSMYAIQIRRFGGPEVVEFGQVHVPEPRQGELLLKVQAASLNPVDWKIRSGKYPAVGEDKLPYVLGRDLSATVVVSDDPQLPPGTLVHGLLDISRGSFAEYAIARPDEVVPVPGTLERVSAAAVPLAGLTAWQGLFDHGGLRAGQTVLIHAGAGGVGHFAVQFAKARGATVIATASSDHVAFVRSLGADEVIDHRQERFDDKVRDLDLVYDLVGGQTQERSWPLLKKGGTLVTTLGEPSQEQARAHGVRATRYTAQSSAAQLREIDALIEAGKVRPHVLRVYDVATAKEAFIAIEEGHLAGKIVLNLASTISGAPDHPWQ